MISFELSEEQKIVRTMIAELGQDVLRPETRRLDEEGRIDSATLEALWATEVIQSQAADDGEAHSSVTNAIIFEELGAADASLALAVASTLGFVQAVRDHGSAEQRRSILPGFRGERFQAASIAIMEPTFGFEVSRLRTKASKSGDVYVLNGVKAQVPLAGQASHFLVVADFDGAPGALIVPRDAAGVSAAEAPGSLGLRALGLTQVRFDDVKVPVSMRLGDVGGPHVQRMVDSARVGLACVMAGLSRGVMEYAIPYVKERKVHGTSLAQKQKVAFDIVDMHIDVEAMRWMNWKAAWQLENRTAEATRAAQLAYTYAGQQCMTIADNGVQTFGGHGFVREHPIELWYRNARSISVLEGVAGI